MNKIVLTTLLGLSLGMSCSYGSEDLYKEGENYYNGKGVTKDPKMAFECFKLSADNYDNPDAQNKVGEMYRSGDGVEKNYKLALKYFKLSANQNNSMAQYSIGDMYLFGKGMKKAKDQKAFKYYKLSADNGYGIAQYRVGEYYRMGRIVEKDCKKAREYLERALKSAQRINDTSLEELAQERLNEMSKLEENDCTVS